MTADTKSLRTIQTIFIALGVAGTLASCYMTWRFGSSISTVHGIGLVLVTIFAAFVFPAKKMLEDSGASKATVRSLAVVGAFAICLEFIGDLGYTFGMRDKQIVESGAQQVTWKSAQASVAETKSQLEAEKKALEKMKAAYEWAGTVSASAERTKLAILQKEIDLEAARGGCKAKCAARMKEKQETEEKIAYAEDMNGVKARIVKLDADLKALETKAAATGVGHSTVAAQTNALAKGFKLVATGGSAEALSPDTVELTIADMVIGLMMAVGACVLPTYAFQIGFFGFKPDAQAHDQHATASVPSVPRATPLAPLGAKPATANGVTVIERVHNHHTTHDFDMSQFIKAIDKARAQAA
jgi:hypothetical protein